MKLKDFNYYLPKNLIAQEPIKPRDYSRLLVIRRGATNAAHANKERIRRETANSAHLNSYKIEHKHFYNIIDYLKKGDVLVLNNAKVFPARLIGKRKKTGGKIEIFLHKKIRGSSWECLVGSSRKREGIEVLFGKRLKCIILKDNKDGTWIVKFNKPQSEMIKIVKMIGHTPLPPYIHRTSDFRYRISDKKNYQTVYADSKKIGSVAAPTAGFHFTPKLIKKLKNKGVQFEYITLHIGLGTFAPVKVNNIKKHKMHAEWVEINKKVIKNIISAKKEGRRIVAVGTTSVRTLEGLIAKKINKPLNQITNYKLPITIFIYPGYRFKVVDAIITNFHLPKSTLFMLVMAFAGKKCIKAAYKEAIKKKYRFYSYGDSMLILSG